MNVPNSDHVYRKRSSTPAAPQPPTARRRRLSRPPAGLLMAMLLIVVGVCLVVASLIGESGVASFSAPLAAATSDRDPGLGSIEYGPTTTVDLAPAGLVDDEWFTTGFLDFPIEWHEPDGKDAGFSMYVAVWPFQETYPGPSFQTGLPSTWLTPMRPDDGTEDQNADAGDSLYSTIEGGLGWWNDTRFATETPKFTMGGVSRDFSEWANGPGAGAGTADVDRRDWAEPQGKYGAAQLSPYVLWAPDGLNLAQESNGELFGYGYHPLPLIDAQTQSSGQDIETGDRSWTLFLSTANFQGPVSFFLPNFFSKPALTDPSVEGLFFDSRGTEPHRSVAMETQVIPSIQATAADGVRYARVTPIQFPVSSLDSSIILNRVASYSNGALWDSVNDWFDGSSAPSGEFAQDETRFSQFDQLDPNDGSSYTIIFEGIDEAKEYPIDWAKLATIDVSDPFTFRYRWNLDLVERNGEIFRLPDYYRLDQSTERKTWTPVRPSEVPTTLGLHDYIFEETGQHNDSHPFETPTDADSIWKSPGPASGPFQAELGDGSTVTYHWYRFVDQPAIQHWSFSDDQRGRMQERVESIHRAWGPNEAYLAPPSVGELANLDPAIIVQPPVGMEAGYVPIVTRQEKRGR